MTQLIEYYNVIKQGVVVKQYTSELHTLSVLNGLVVIQNKDTRKIDAVISPNAYDYIEVEREEAND